MRCNSCGGEVSEGAGYWTKIGFLCISCYEGMGFFPCDSCGLRFPRSELKEYENHFYCNNCLRVVRPVIRPKAPKRAAIGARVVRKKEGEEARKEILKELEPSPYEVGLRAKKILMEKYEVEERKNKGNVIKKTEDLVFQVLSSLKSIIRGKDKKEDKYQLETK